jgi:hypothetical protein
LNQTKCDNIGGDGVMVMNAAFNNILVIWWGSVLLVEETEDTVETTNLSQVTEPLYRVARS